MIRRPPRSTLFPYTTLFRSLVDGLPRRHVRQFFNGLRIENRLLGTVIIEIGLGLHFLQPNIGFPVVLDLDRKSTRLNSSHLVISYAVFCLKKKKIIIHEYA